MPSCTAGLTLRNRKIWSASILSDPHWNNICENSLFATVQEFYPKICTMKTTGISLLTSSHLDTLSALVTTTPLVPILASNIQKTNSKYHKLSTGSLEILWLSTRDGAWKNWKTNTRGHVVVGTIRSISHRSLSAVQSTCWKFTSVRQCGKGMSESETLFMRPLITKSLTAG